MGRFKEYLLNEQQTFLNWIKNRKFKNPETDNEVLYYSLPEKERDRIMRLFLMKQSFIKTNDKIIKKDNIEPGKEIEILPKEVTIAEEAKRVGVKRISPDRVAHQKLTPKEGIESLIEKAKKKANNNSESWLKASGQIQKLIDKYGNKIPSRTESNIQKYPELTNDLYVYNYLKKNVHHSIDLKDLKNQFVKIAEINKWNSEREQKYREKVIDEYKELIRSDISKGYKYPEEVLNYDKSFRTAVDSRAKYEKGLRTSFSSDDERIVFDEVDKIGAGMKRQDGKHITEEQKNEIKNGVIDFAKALNLNMKKLAENDRWVYVHLNEKNPFLMKNTAGLYRQGKDNISISVGGVETFDKIVGGKKVRETVNTTIAHELGHALDFKVKNKLFDTNFIFHRKYDFKRGDSGYYIQKYFRKDNEIVARMIEQYVSVKKGSESFYEREGYWKKEIFESEIKPSVENAIKKHFFEYLL